MGGAERVRTTWVSEVSVPTLPANTTYGMPQAGPSMGSQRETMPGSIGPLTMARLIDSPCTATSDDVPEGPGHILDGP